MLYEKYLKKGGAKDCPFCNIKQSEVLKENTNAILTLAKAPYTTDHLLVIPKKHALTLEKLDQKQYKDTEKLMFYAIKKLHNKYKNVSMLYRQGDQKESGKSIDHLHIHIIPKLKIGAYNINMKDRTLMSEASYNNKIKKLKSELKKL